MCVRVRAVLEMWCICKLATKHQVKFFHFIFLFVIIYLSFSLQNGLNQSDILSDMTEYLKDFPADMLLDSSNFFSQFSKLLNTEKHDGADMANIKDVVQGKKEVAVPPGISCI